ncbi:MAG: hypothetical protein ACMVY4_17190 [Minwuia sp.]|uniref:hypothetical protein n=1 Tax=Minwuia sp. TaxID=2493630 RepID=UPI003A8B5E9A
MKNLNLVLAVAAGFTIALVAANGVAADDAYPKLSGEVGIEVQNDYTFDSDDPAAEQNELGATIEPAVTLQFSETVSLNTELTLEAQRDPGPKEDRVFQDHGLAVSVLTLNYDGERFGVYGGKFGPNFALAWDAAAGLYGTDVAEDLELADFLGAGGYVNFGDTALGSLVGSASVFFTDTTILSESFITNRGRTRQAAGEPGNTESPESFALALDGEAVPGLDGFGYHVGYALLSADNASTEHRFAFAGYWELELENGVTLVPLLEYARIENADSNANESRSYVTGSLGAEWGNWNAALAYTGKIVTISGNGNGDSYDDQIGVSFGYAWDNGIGLDVGYKHNRTAGIATQTVGALLSYGFEF